MTKTVKHKKCYTKSKGLSKDTRICHHRSCKYVDGGNPHKSTYCKLCKNSSFSNTTKKNRIFTLSKVAASRKIGDFMQKTATKRKSRFLKIICPNSDVCIAMGSEINKINEFFNHYTDFAYAFPPIRQIGAESTNGFIKEIKYERDDYTSYAVLKSSVAKNTDNLMYEYEVGQYINKQNRIFSCFLETYGLFSYNDNDAWSHCRNTPINYPHELKNHITLLDTIDYSIGCSKSKHLAVLLQHVNKAISLRNVLESPITKYTINFEIPYILYQIYFALSVLKDEFTHYDLHDENVLLYEPVINGYVTYHYHLLSGDTVEFHSKYIAKIIDYGRSYYYDGPEQNSKKTYDNICSIQNCNSDLGDCGYESGLKYLSRPTFIQKRYYIISQIKNVSHDLRLVDNIKPHFLGSLNSYLFLEFSNLLKKIVYSEEKYGSIELTSSGLPKKINNVTDMYNALEQMIIKPDYKSVNDSYMASKKKVGDLHIYQDKRPMHFIKNNITKETTL
jgi:hypothetical protein